MRIVLCALLFLAGVIQGSVYAGAIQYQATDLGQNAFRISYSLSDFTFLANQELAIEFDPAVYLSLSNGMAPDGFKLVLLQPDNPPGTLGEFSARALIDNPALTGFSVDVLLAANRWPGEQNFAVNQMDGNGIILSMLSSGVTTDATAPEPATLPLAGAALLTGAVLSVLRRRLNSRT